MKYSFYSSISVKDILTNFSVEYEKGLSDKQVLENQKKFGKNIPFKTKNIFLKIFFRQFWNIFFFLLLFASIMSFVLGDNYNALLILLFILINVVLGFYQEYKSENIITSLRNLIISKVVVLRNSKKTWITINNIVPGDILILEPGDIIPADVRFLKVVGVSVDESILTGESVPVFKSSDEVNIKSDENLSEFLNLGFAGTTLVTGSAQVIVLSIGKESFLGKISHLSENSNKIGLFTKEINRFGIFVVVMMFLVLAIVLFFHIFIKSEKIEFFQLIFFVIALSVALVPEALPVVISFSLAKAAFKMANKKVVVKRLSSIEDLGSLEVLCIDKTGTITENKLEVSDVFGDKTKVLNYAFLASSELSFIGKRQIYSFDRAIDLEIKKIKIRSNINLEKVYHIPFTSVERCSYSLYKNEENRFIAIIRGMFEVVLDKVVYLGNDLNKKDIKEWVINRGEEGKRIIAVAIKEFDKEINLEQLIKYKDFDFLGMISFIDPIKSTVFDSLTHINNLGIKLKLITGDSPEVAYAVAKKLGLIEKKEDVVLGFDLEKIFTNQTLIGDFDKIVFEKIVFARINPFQKLMIIKKLREKCRVGFLGEGINDVLALREVDVAIATDNATDVAKDIADIVLMESSLKVIAEGILEGRLIIKNIVKYLKVTMTSNFSNFYTLSIVSLFINFLPMLPIQILLLNLLSDFPLISVATDSVDFEEIKKPAFYYFYNIIGIAVFLGIISSFFDMTYFSFFIKKPPAVVQTGWFLFSVLTEIVLFYSIRTKKLFFRAKAPSQIINFLALVSIFISIFLISSNLGKILFKFSAISFRDYFVIFLVVITYFLSIEILKVIYRFIEGRSVKK